MVCLPWKAPRKPPRQMRKASRRTNCRFCERLIRGSLRDRCNSCDTTIRRIRGKLAAISYLGGKCVRCRCSFPWVLQFHHLRDKDFVIGNVVNRKWEIVKAELDKCELLCANCHITEHTTRRGIDKKLLQEAMIIGKIGSTEIKELIKDYLIGTSRYSKQEIKDTEC